MNGGQLDSVTEKIRAWLKEQNLLGLDGGWVRDVAESMIGLIPYSPPDYSFVVRTSVNGFLKARIPFSVIHP